MRFNQLFSFAVVFGLFFLTGCISVKSYVDPQYSKAEFIDIQKVENRYHVKIVAEFQRDGVRKEGVDKHLQKVFEKVLRASDVFVLDQTAESVVYIKVNNIADLGSAAAKGFGTGLTFGLMGSEVADYYDITISMTNQGATITKAYKHGLLSTIGNHKPPLQNVEASTPEVAFMKVVEDATLNFIKEMQDSGKLSFFPYRLELTVPLERTGAG